MGRGFYGLPLNEGTVTLERAPVQVPAEIAGVVPFHAGETLGWRFVGRQAPSAPLGGTSPVNGED
jgi:dihydroorotase